MAYKESIYVFDKQGMSQGRQMAPGTYVAVIQLPHPKGYPMALACVDGNLFELNACEPSKFTSWFINQRTCSDKSFYMVTQLDPRFLLIPYLRKNATKYSPLDQIVIADGSHECDRFPLAKASEWKLEDMCDMKDLGDLMLYRYSEEKISSWLKGKVERLAELLAEKRVKRAKKENSLYSDNFNFSAQAMQNRQGLDSASSNEINRSGAGAVEVKPYDVLEAAQIVCDYIMDDQICMIAKALGLNEADLICSKQPTSSKRKADWETELELEKETDKFMYNVNNNKPSSAAVGTNAAGKPPSTSGSGSGSQPPVKKTPTTSSMKSKPAPTGMKSIASFFGKK